MHRTRCCDRDRVPVRSGSVPYWVYTTSNPPPSRGAIPRHFIQGSQVCAQMLGRGEVGVVEGVLRTVVAPDVALAAQAARQPRQAVEVAVLRFGDDLLGRRLATRPARTRSPAVGGRSRGQCLRGLPQRLRPWVGPGTAYGLGVQHRFHGRVVLLEVAAADRPVLVSATGEWRVRARTSVRPCEGARWHRSGTHRRARWR